MYSFIYIINYLFINILFIFLAETQDLMREELPQAIKLKERVSVTRCVINDEKQDPHVSKSSIDGEILLGKIVGFFSKTDSTYRSRIFQLDITRLKLTLKSYKQFPFHFLIGLFLVSHKNCFS